MLSVCARRCTFVLLGLLLAPVAAFAQQTGSIQGKVTDTSGAVLPGVTVEAKSNVLPSARTTVSGTDGIYQLPQLPPGPYTITFTLSGFQTASRQADVQLEQVTQVDAKLAVQGVTEAVTVTADPTGLQVGTYTGSLNVSGGSGNPVVVTVTFGVGSISASPTSIPGRPGLSSASARSTPRVTSIVLKPGNLSMASIRPGPSPNKASPMSG